MKKHTESSLLALFNAPSFCEFIKLQKDGSYLALEWPKGATHQLIATRWNTQDERKLWKGMNGMPLNYALSVCAVPCIRRQPRARSKIIHITRNLPKTHPMYDIYGAEGGKRRVLRWMVQAMRAKEIKLNALKSYPSAQCDMLYKALRRADFWL